MKTQHKHLLQRTYLVLVFGFMYLPIAVLIAYSFNAVSYTHLTLPTIA